MVWYTLLIFTGKETAAVGKKYASIHIRTDDPENDLETYLLFQREEKPAFDRRKALINLVQKPEEQAEIDRFLGLMTKSVLIIMSRRFISVCDENDSFESVEKKARNISRQFDNPIVFTSNFDDDVFVFGVCKGGQCITRGTAGANLDRYGLECSAIDTERFLRTVSAGGSGPCRGLDSLEDIRKIENALEEYLRLPLSIKASDIGFDYERYPDVKSEDGYMLLRLTN